MWGAQSGNLAHRSASEDVPLQNLLSSKFGTKFKREVPLLLETTQSHVTPTFWKIRDITQITVPTQCSQG